MTVFTNNAEHIDMLNIIAAGAAARRRASERAKQETEFSRAVQRILELCKMQEVPPVDTDAAKQFAAWCRDRGETLPVPARTVAGYLVERLLEDTSMDDLRRAADAILHLHVVGQWFLDPRPINAALAFAAKTHELAGGGPDDDGDGQPIVNPASPPANDYEAMPLAAGAAI